MTERSRALLPDVDTHVSRRHFLRRVGAGLAASPLLLGGSLSSGQIPAPPAGLRMLPKALLGPGDFEFLGAMKTPWDVSGFSGGQIALRKSGSTTTFLIPGNVARDPKSLFEISCPGFSTNASTAPRATVVNRWPDVFLGKRQTWGDPTDLRSNWTEGFLWHDGFLYWAYGQAYNAGAPRHDPSIGFTDLSRSPVTAYGPFRTKTHSQKTRGYLTVIPKAFADAYTGGRRLAVGAGLHSGNAACSWGLMLAAVDVPTLATRPSDVNNESDVSLSSVPLVEFSLSQRMSRDPDYIPHGSPDIAPSGGSGVWTQIDFLTSCCWVDLPDKHGVIFMGSLGTDHVWYGQTQCAHGQSDPCYNGTGEHSSRRAARWWIADPAQLAEVAQGRRAAHAVLPAYTLDPGAMTPFALEMGCRRLANSAVCDPETRTLYVSYAQAEPGDIVERPPLVHAWRIR